MKLETLLLLAAAAGVGYVIATQKGARAAKPAAPAAALPTATPNVVIEEYDIYDYGPWGYGYPRWGGSRRGGGRHGGHHGGHH